MEIGTNSSLDVYSLINRAIGSLEEGHAEDIKSSKISVKANKKAIEEKRQERLDKILDNLRHLSRGKCLGFLKFVVKVFEMVAAPISGGASLALNLGGILLNGLNRLQQAKNQKNYLLSKEDEAILKRVIDEVKELFDDEIQQIKQADERHQRELVEMKQAIEQVNQERSFL